VQLSRHAPARKTTSRSPDNYAIGALHRWINFDPVGNARPGVDKVQVKTAREIKEETRPRSAGELQVLPAGRKAERAFVEACRKSV
jgi:hypothetical protein